MVPNVHCLINGLESRSFELEADCPWRRLGVAKFEGPKQELGFIRGRERLLRDLLELAAETDWGKEPQHQLNLQARSQLVEEAGSRCTEDSDEVLQQHRRFGVEREGWGRWLE